MATVHVIPLNDLKEHVQESTCECGPQAKIVEGGMVITHMAFDGRHLVEQAEELLHQSTSTHSHLHTGGIMAVRAKFFVVKVNKNEDGSGTVFLSPVSAGSKENDEFYQLTPAGSIEISTLNPQAIAQFEDGKTYFVDFTEAPKE